MPYLGGSSTNAGIRYQAWFGVLHLSYAYFESNYELYPESLGEIINDLLIKNKGKSTYYTVKRNAANSSLNWTPSQLIRQNVIEEVCEQYIAKPNTEICLISESPCYLFNEVFRRGSQALSSIDIYNKLESTECIAMWDKLKGYLGWSDQELIGLSQKVRSRTLPIEEIQYFIRHRFNLITSERHVADFLFDKVLESSEYKDRINKTTIIKWFQNEGIKFNRHE